MGNSLGGANRLGRHGDGRTAALRRPAAHLQAACSVALITHTPYATGRNSPTASYRQARTRTACRHLIVVAAIVAASYLALRRNAAER